MKCMAELLEMREVAKEAERIRQLQLDEEARRDFAKIAQKTIEFCETVVSPKLEALALGTVDKIAIEFQISGMREDRLGNKEFSLLKSQGKKYADGRESFTPTYDYLSIDALKAYLEHHCIKCSLSEIDYWHYGWGCYTGYKLKIYI